MDTAVEPRDEATGKGLKALETREMPPAPKSLMKIIGPGIVGAGIGLASGEFVLWPYIASQVGLVLLWGAAIGIAIQWFLNMEIERYTLATGETALTGFSRLGRHWGLVLVVMAYFANLWPGWASSSAKIVTFLVGGDATTIAVGMLAVIGVGLTFAPVVYTLLERVNILKVVAVSTLVVGSFIFVVSPEGWRALPSGVTHFGQVPPSLPFALVMGAFAFAGAGGGQNLCQSNWIRDKGYGMGAYVPKLVSPITGQEEAKPSTGFIFEPTEENLARWKGWWRMANIEQGVTFGLISFLTIVATSLIAYSTLFGQPDLPNSIDFLKFQGEQMGAKAGAWMKTLFWCVGAFSLFGAALGIVDYTCRLGADVVKTVYLRDSAITENRLYFGLVWGMVSLGASVLLLGFNQPLVLLVISACTGGLMMFLYSMLLLVLNRKLLPKPIQTSPLRTLALILATLMFAALSALTLMEQVQKFK